MIWLAFLSAVIGYLLGSIPSAYIAGRLKGVNILRVGGRNPGTLNVMREVGMGFGVAVLFVDVGKGVAAVFVAQQLGVPYLVVLLAGLAAVLGHDFPVFLRFKGGKGVATTMGVLLILAPQQFLIAFGIGLIAILITRNVTLGMGVQFIALPFILWGFHQPGELIAYSAVLALISGTRHLPTFREALSTRSTKDVVFDRWPWVKDQHKQNGKRS